MDELRTSKPEIGIPISAAEADEAVRALLAGRTPRQPLPFAAEVYLLESGHLQHRFDSRLYSVAYGWSKRREIIQSEVLRASKGLPAPDILELGCHKGGDLFQFAKMLEHRGRYVGMDLSHEFVRFAGQWAKLREVPRTVWAVADAHRIPCRDASFDVLVATEMVEHIPNPERTTVEFARVLRPGGTAIVSTVNPSTAAARLGKWVDRFTGGRLRQAVLSGMEVPQHDHDHGHDDHDGHDSHDHEKLGYSNTAEYGTRDPGHVAELPLKMWAKLFEGAGFRDTRVVPGSVVYGAPFFDRHRGLFATLLLAEATVQRISWFHDFCQAGTIVARRGGAQEVA